MLHDKGSLRIECIKYICVLSYLDVDAYLCPSRNLSLPRILKNRHIYICRRNSRVSVCREETGSREDFASVDRSPQT